MRTRTITQMKLVEASTPTELMYKFNEMMDEVSRLKVNADKPVISLDTLTAYVVYTEQEVVAESRDDYHALRGEHFHCGDCKYFHENDLHNGSAKEEILYVPRNKDGSVNKTSKRGVRYLELKERGAVK